MLGALCLSLAVLGAGCATGHAAPRAVAVTFDDLPGPAGGLVSNDPSAVLENTRRLIAALGAAHVPAIGFVNEGKLAVDGDTVAGRETRVAALRAWLAAGFELGNHTYSHRSMNRTPLGDFEADVVRGESVTRALMAERGLVPRYFRHPFLHVGLDLDTRRAFEAFLAARGYTVAPVTIDNDEYVFAAVYAEALRGARRGEAGRVADAYLEYMRQVVEFSEEVTLRLLGRTMPQVLLLHANSLNGDRLTGLLGMLRDRGYRFVALDDALRDQAFGQPDTYVGAWGVSWLHHWEITQGRPRSPSPDPPAWIQQAYDALTRSAAAPPTR